MKRKRHMHILRTVFMAFAVLAVVASPLTIDIGGIRINDVSAQSSSSQQACEADGKHSWQPGYINEMGLEVGATCTPIGASIADKYSETGPTSCSGFLLSMASPFTCAGRALAALTSATLIFAASWILTFSGNLFNWLVENTIIQFSAWYDSISVAVEQAWGAFRDIANILIIGIFTFTAISIILGIKEYGQKKTIAKVLVIAVLINFSLLFAKIIVDASNYTATQIYNTAGLNVGDTSNQSVGAAQQSAAASGIAGTFIDLLGVRSFGNALQSINDIAEARDNGWIALLHGILVFAILGGAALVLLYGSFLLLSRALMIIFLFITASLAFATYLVPKLAATKVGWSTWWSSLLKSAALAPLLMFFLWATLNVAYNLVGPVGSASRGALGDIVTSPDGTASLNAMVSYMMILGLLFITFKLSSSFASGITNFNFAQAVGASPFTLGSRFLVGGLGRLTAGRFAYARGSRLGKEAAELRDEAARTSVAAKRHERSGNFPLADQAREEARKLREAAAGKIKQQAAAGKWAGRRFNFMDTSVAKTATKAVGVTGFASGASSKGTLEQSYADQVKTRAAAAESAAAKVAPSGEDLDKSAEKERMSLFEQRQAHHDQLEATKNAAAANA
ncbi:MAG: hypothetical protein U1D26_01825, partial [Patescibacteria group bacterium]|nr:hypothetical protein [Patescibacteria group bacterium]